MGVTHNLILGGGASLPTMLNVTVSGGTATSVTATLGSRGVSLAYDSTSDLWSATLPKNATGNWTVTATDGSKTVSDLVEISGPGIWSMELALGPLPSGYTQLEYIESTGTQYINTGIYHNSSMTLFCRLMTLSQNSSFAFGSRTANGSKANTYNNNGWCGFFNQNLETSGAISKNAIYEIQNGPNGLYVDGVLKQSWSYSGSYTADYPAYIFAMTNAGSVNSGTFIGRIYSFSAFTGETINANFIPARRNSDSVLGMYDTVTNTFYTNAGSGSFIAGPEVTQLAA